jgi:hypothetical protein
LIERKLSGVECWGSTSKVPDATSEVKVVCQSDTMAGGSFVDFVLAVTVEYCPLDLGTCGLVFGRPVEDDLLACRAGIADSQLATLMCRWE